MAIIANIAAGDVFWIFAGCAASVMTQAAFKRCALEHPADVAAGAVQKLMLSGQWEPGSEMVEAIHLVSSMC